MTQIITRKSKESVLQVARVIIKFGSGIKRKNIMVWKAVYQPDITLASP